MKRTFNYTGRHLIPQECIDARIMRMSTGMPSSLEVDFDFGLADQLSDIPPTAKVFVDASFSMSFMRFYYGEFNSTRVPADTLLTELDSWSSADFTVRIVHNGQLLAMSKNLTVTLAAPTSKTRLKLLTTAYEDIGELPWKLDVHETIATPTLVFNERWWDACLDSGYPLSDQKEVMQIIMPSVVQRMLEWILIHNKGDHHELYDDQTWKGAWIRMARGLTPGKSPPRPNQRGDYDDVDEVSEWIEEAVSEWSKVKGLTSSLVHLVKSTGGV